MHHGLCIFLCVSQESPTGERAALAMVVEPLMQVAKQHGSSRETFARKLVTSLLDQFLDVEERFQLSGEATTEQEVVDALRKVGMAFYHLAVFNWDCYSVSAQQRVPEGTSCAQATYRWSAKVIWAQAWH